MEGRHGREEKDTDYLGKNSSGGSSQRGGVSASRFPSVLQGYTGLQFVQSDNGNAQELSNPHS